MSCTIEMMRVRKYRSDRNPQALADNYLNNDEDEVKLQLVGVGKHYER